MSLPLHSTPNYHEVDVNYLRNLAKHWVSKNTHHLIFGADTSLRFPSLRTHGCSEVRKEEEFLESYYGLQILADTVASLAFSAVAEKAKCPIDIDSSNLVMPSTLIRKDTKRVILPIALVAWLTIDNFRWHTSACIPNRASRETIPTDLNYGLVLSYPTYVIPYACFVLGTHREAQMKLLDQDCMQECEMLTQQIVQSHFPALRP